MRRVVVTGVGFVSPLGSGSEVIWSRLAAGAHGIRLLDEEICASAWTSDETKPRGASVKVAGIVPDMDAVAVRDKSRFIQHALKASDLALDHAGLSPPTSSSSADAQEAQTATTSSPYDAARMGVAIASGIGAINETVDGSAALDKSERKLSPFFIPRILINMAAGQVSLHTGFKGPNHSVATACAAGAHAIGDAFNFIRLNYADAMLAGGSEACVGALGVSGFGRMRALSTSGNPNNASRPFHPERDGFVIAEGAAVLVLEELEHAKTRGAPIVAELVGYGLSGDAHHATSPSPVGDGAIRAMRGALECAGLDPSHVGYVNAHATSTPTGDSIELAAIAAVFGDPHRSQDNPLHVSSTKGATGHMLGAAGAFEGAVAALAARDGLLPPSLGLADVVDEQLGIPADSPLQLVRGSEATSVSVRYTMSNSFGFGGTNASLLFKHYDDGQ